MSVKRRLFGTGRAQRLEQRMRAASAARLHERIVRDRRSQIMVADRSRHVYVEPKGQLALGLLHVVWSKR